MTDERPRESISLLDRKLSSGCEDREVVLRLAAAYRQAGRAAEAAELLLRHLEEGAVDWEACRECVECFRDAQRMEEAVGVMNRWASLYRDRAEFWLLRGLILEEMGGSGAVAYLGDDRTDEDAFEAIAGKGLGVLVRPERRPTAAEVWLKPPGELLDFLDQWQRRAERGRLETRP